MHKTRPMFVISELPDVDQKDAYHVTTLLAELDSFSERFAAALELINHTRLSIAEANNKRKKQQDEEGADQAKVHNEFFSIWPMLHQWSLIAESDAIRTIWDFATTVYNIRKGLDRCASLNAMVNRPALEKALKEISDRFPDRKDARNATSHPADFQKSANEMQRHSAKGPLDAHGFSATEEAAYNMRHVSTGNGTVLHTSKGGLLESNVSEESLSTLRAIADMVWECFSDAEKILRQRVIDRGSALS